MRHRRQPGANGLFWHHRRNRGYLRAVGVHSDGAAGDRWHHGGALSAGAHERSGIPALDPPDHLCRQHRLPRARGLAVLAGYGLEGHIQTKCPHHHRYWLAQTMRAIQITSRVASVSSFCPLVRAWSSITLGVRRLNSRTVICPSVVLTRTRSSLRTVAAGATPFTLPPRRLAA